MHSASVYPHWLIWYDEAIMKGFGIEIKNNLLENKHVEQMGNSVWLYMWCIDKMTSISEQGIGKVLGGKPIKYPEVFKELGITQKTYSRWLSNLRTNGYINTKRTPYGIIFSVNKAFKRFGKRTDKNVLSNSPKKSFLLDKNVLSNKTKTVDKISMTNQEELNTSERSASDGKLNIRNYLKRFQKPGKIYSSKHLLSTQICEWGGVGWDKKPRLPIPMLMKFCNLKGEQYVREAWATVKQGREVNDPAKLFMWQIGRTKVKTAEINS